MSPRRRVGLLGGTFDPVHAGHLDVANTALAALCLDELRFVVNNAPPHKPPAEASAWHRFAMVALATATEPRLLADPRELQRPGPSWTIDTLEGLEAELPEAEFVLIVGADSLRDFRCWRSSDDILRKAHLAAIGRDGVDLDSAAAAAAITEQNLTLIRHVPPPWSSRDLRQGLHAGKVPSGSIPVAVVEYIRKHGLYSLPSTGDAAARRTHA